MWDTNCEQTFQSIKEFLEKAPLLSNPTTDEVLYMYIDFTNKVASDVLVVDKEGRKNLVYYVSHSLIGA